MVHGKYGTWEIWYMAEMVHEIMVHGRYGTWEMWYMVDIVHGRYKKKGGLVHGHIVHG